jgi:hypothetical protein
MNYFSNIIIKGYIEYTVENEDNIAHFFFQEHHKVRPMSNSDFIYTKEHFFKKLIREINKLISSTVHNRHIDKSLYNYDTQINEEEEFKTWEEKRLKDHQLMLDDNGVNITAERKCWETHTNAKEVNEALNEGLHVKDPIRIISFDNEINSKDLVLRKSKLEFLKTEAERAKKAITIDELDELDEVDLSTLSIDNSKEESDNNEIKKAVKEAFKFTLKIDPRKKVKILSDEDFTKLINWVSFYYENNLTLPDITKPIMTVNTAKDNIRTAFKKFFVLLHPTKTKPDSFFKLITSCFHPYRYDKKSTIEKCKTPHGYNDLVAKSK